MKLVSGDAAPKSGTYRIIGNKGEVINTVNVNKGDRMPPTLSPGHYFEIN